jgi:hypothetical protein
MFNKLEFMSTIVIIREFEYKREINSKSTGF